MGIRDYLNAKTNYLIDWNRPGSLLASNHHYSTRELAERAFVIAATAAGGFLFWNQSEEGGATPFVFGAALGFFISHAITMSPLIYKRKVAEWACDTLKEDINLKTKDTEASFSLLVSDVVDKVMQESHSKSASQVWGRRKRLLTNLLEWLNNDRISLEQLTDTLNSTDIIHYLDENTLCVSLEVNLR